MRAEAELQRAILLRYGNDSRLRLWRSNTGVAFDSNGRPVRFGLKGQPDLTGITAGGRFVGIEVKAPKGQLSDEQCAFGAMLIRWGGLYVVARALEDVEAALNGVPLPF